MSLRRYPNEGVLGGVCAGVGRFLDIEAWIIRLITCVLFVLCGVGLVPYILLWIFVPKA